MRSDAQKRADQAYAKKKIRVVLEFNQESADDMTLIDWLNSQPSKTPAIKHLIKEHLK